MNVDSVMFQGIFKIHSHNVRVLQWVSREIKRFHELKAEYEAARKRCPRNLEPDLLFEFLVWMEARIADAERRMPQELRFAASAKTAQGAVESGHVINMANQLRLVLHDSRVSGARQRILQQAAATEFRRCPYCGLLWTKKEGCEGDTYCGSDPTASHWHEASLKPNYAAMATFTFRVDESSGSVEIKRTAESVLEAKRSFQGVGKGFGCGMTVNFRRMAPASFVAQGFFVIPEVVQ